MKKRVGEIAIEKEEELNDKKITRKQAITKTGYIAISVATTMILLATPKRAVASTTYIPFPGDWPPSG